MTRFNNHIGLFNKLLNWINSLVLSFFRYPKNWKEIERFNVSWNKRVEKMALMIPESTQSILDMGCGTMHLSSLIPRHIKYYGLDYTPRNDKTIVCDVNKDRLPDQHFDLVFMSGFVEYVEDLPSFIPELKKISSNIVLSYCATDYFPDYRIRKKNAWKNDLSKNQLIQLFQQYMFDVKKGDLFENQIILYLTNSNEVSFCN